MHEMGSSEENICYRIIKSFGNFYLLGGKKKIFFVNEFLWKIFWSKNSAIFRTTVHSLYKAERHEFCSRSLFKRFIFLQINAWSQNSLKNFIISPIWNLSSRNCSLKYITFTSSFKNWMINKFSHGKNSLQKNSFSI